jgi:hypothetical protein
VAASPAQSAKKQKAPSCFKTDQPVTCNISDLRPTQFNAGMEEVEAQSKKAKEILNSLRTRTPHPSL